MHSSEPGEPAGFQSLFSIIRDTTIPGYLKDGPAEGAVFLPVILSILFGFRFELEI